MRSIAFGGLVPALLFIGCQVQERVAAPDSAKADKMFTGNSIIREYAEFNPAKINISSAPPVFRDDTIPAPEPNATKEWDGVPLKKAAAVTWTQLAGRCNDVAIGESFYCVDKVTLKLKKWVNNSWVVVPGPKQDGIELTFRRVAAAKRHSGNPYESLVAIASNGAPYLYDAAAGTWYYFPGGGNGVDIAVDMDRAIRYLGTNNTLYTWNRTSQVWVAVAGQAGQRLSVDGNRTYLVSNGYYLYMLVPVGSDPAVVKGNYTGAFTVNDVCGGSAQWYGGDNNPILMHSGSGYVYRYVYNPTTWQWTRLFGDSNTRNLACANSDLEDHWTVVLQTNNDGYTFYTQFRDI
jgi:hypothetical protein